MRRVLVDTSVWVDHFRQGNASLVELLQRDGAVVHPLVLGEIACGSPPDRQRTLRDLSELQSSLQASAAEVMALIDQHQLFGLGCGWIDLSLLASTLLTPDVALWTYDKRLAALARRFQVEHEPSPH